MSESHPNSHRGDDAQTRVVAALVDMLGYVVQSMPTSVLDVSTQAVHFTHLGSSAAVSLVSSIGTSVAAGVSTTQASNDTQSNPIELVELTRGLGKDEEWELV